MKDSDLIKELFYTFIAVFLFIALLALIFKSPYTPPVSIRQFAIVNPVGYEQTALSYLMGTDSISSYGPPFTSGQVKQKLGVINPEGWMGTATPINPKQDFILTPLAKASLINPQISGWLVMFNKASLSKQAYWEKNYNNVLNNAAVVNVNGQVAVKPGNYGPVEELMSYMLSLGRSGFLTSEWDKNLKGNNSAYQYNFQNSLLFLQDTALADKAAKDNMLGSQMGIIKEDASYPGPWWLAYYNYLYLFPPIDNSPSADLLVFITVMLTFLALLLVPFIPGVNRIPYIIPIYKLIWRRYYAAKN